MSESLNCPTCGKELSRKEALELPIIHNVVGKCSKCGKEVDNAVEGYITSSEGKMFHDPCYAQE